MTYAMILLGIAALGGLTMAGIRFAGAPRPPTWLAMLHGLLAAAGLTLLIEAALTVGIPRLAEIGLCILLLAAVGGAAINLMYHDKQLALPKSWVIAHALLAIVGFGLLLASVL
jgi:hypothetical protein